MTSLWVFSPAPRRDCTWFLTRYISPWLPNCRALGNGVVYVAPNNPRALADAIASLISSYNILVRKQSDAARSAQRFTSDIITRELSQWIKEH